MVRWKPILVLLLITIVTWVSLGHASPPGSRGARPIALGNGYTSVAGDAYSLYYNPAGLSEINQKEVVGDFGRSNSVGESARTDFNTLYALPYRYKDQFIPLAFGLYGETPAPGAHIFEFSGGGGMDAPADRWTKGIIKFPVRIGAAATIRQQSGKAKSDRVGKSSIGLGLTGGLYFPIDRVYQAGFAIRNLFLGKANPDGPSLDAGISRRQNEYLDMYADLEYGSGGVWRFSPGLEWLLARGMVRPRLGWGSHDNGGIDSIATGLGIYVSPAQIDIAYMIPLKTLTDDTEQFRVSLSYRFGKPQFTEIYYDRALEAASVLDNQVLTMTVKEAELKSSVSELEQKRRLAREELQNLKARIEALKNQDLLGARDAKIHQLEERVRSLEGNLSNERGQVKELREKKATVRTYTVKAGDTLQSLAREYYGDPNQWKKIYNANPDKIDRGLPRVGAVLVIP